LLECTDAVGLDLIYVVLQIAAGSVDRYTSTTDDLAAVSEELPASTGSKHYASDDRLLVTKCEVVVPGRRVSISRDFSDYGEIG
jgi:hypothetical protein